VTLTEDQLQTNLAPLSWNMFRVHVTE